MKKYEPNSFRLITGIVILIFTIVIAAFIWFVYIGHEPYEPIHDENPHAFLNYYEQMNDLERT